MKSPSIHKYRSTAATMIIALVLITMCEGCSKDDDDSLPPYKVDLVEANTNHDGNVTAIRFDNGVTYDISRTIEADTPDTTYRCVCTYEVTDGNMNVFSLSHIFSAMPRKRADFKTEAYDPVKLTSCWKSGGYLNLKIGLMTTNEGSHKFGFCEESVVNRKVYFTLMHERPKEDAESFTKDMFLSIPIRQYDCDSVCIRVMTYEGWQQVDR